MANPNLQHYRGTTERRSRIKKVMRNIHREEMKKTVQASFERQLKKTGVFSFAGDPRSILMWSHYASNHTGICIQFEVARDVENMLYAFDVEYSEEYPVINWLDKEEYGHGIGKVLLRKNKEWEYEREYRIVMVNKAGKCINFKPEAVAAVIFGWRMHENAKNSIERIIAQRKRCGLPELRVYKAVKHSTKYKLVIHG